MRRFAQIILTLGAPIAAGCVKEGSSAPATVDARAVSYSEGGDSAKVHIVYFGDYVCDDCAKFSKAASAPLRHEWAGKGRARLTVVDLAWHRGSVAGSAAAWCAAEQGKFWEMHDLLYAKQEEWKRAVDIPAALETEAAALGVDRARYRACAAKPDHQRRLDAAEEASREFGIRGTPAFLVNGKVYYGSQEWGWVEQVLVANERGTPEAAPPPPFKVPTKRIVDSVKLKTIQDSLAAAGKPIPAIPPGTP